jgi:DNA-binding LytR/AlgR family response regulator
MNCIIIEDQPPAQRILKKYIEEIGTLNLVGVFPDALKALELLNSTAVDLIFLDIHLPKLSGIDFLKSLPSPPHVILTTAFPDYALESYEFNVVDYLLKPFSFTRFVKAISKIPNRNASEKTNPDTSKTTSIFVKTGYDYIRVEIEDIIFIRSDADYTELVTNGKKYLSSETLRHWEQELDKDLFFRTHKSYMINGDKITKISGNQVFLMHDHQIPIGRTYKEAFAQRFLK